MEGLKELSNALSNGTISDPLRPLFPKIGGSPSLTRNSNRYIISKTGEATDFIGRNIRRVHPNKSPLQFLKKRERGRIQGLPKFFWVDLPLII